MKIGIIIAEYNPFHEGHKYLISKAKELGYSHIISIMSGNFVQRGEPAILPKFFRAKTALENGVDLVLELPTRYALSTAMHFAKGATQIAEKINCGSALIFGSESGDIDFLINTAKKLKDIKINNTNKDITFAKARENALGFSFFSPNDILATEYINNLQKLSPVAIKRGDFESASEIRKKMTGFNYDEFYKIAFGILKRLDKPDFALLPDISEGIENRIYDSIRFSASYEEMLATAKTKRYTMARIKRLCLYAVLGLAKTEYDKPIDYVRILGMNNKGLEILNLMKEKSKIPFGTELKDEFESRCTDLYEMNKPSGSDYRERVIKI